MTTTLVIQPLPGIGDMIWHLPCLHALAGTDPDGRVDVLTKRRSKADQLLADDPAIERVLWLDRDARHRGLRGLKRLARDIAAGAYRHVWVLHNSARYGWAARLAGVPHRHGFGPRWRRLLFNHWIDPGPEVMKLHPVPKARRVLESAGVRITESEPRLPVGEAARSAMDARFADMPRPWIGIGIGSSEPFKQWGAERFADTIRQLHAHAGGSFFLLGGPGEQGIARNIQAACPEARTVSALALGIRDMVALIAGCRLYLGNDTGFLNVAAAVGVPAVGLFGGSPLLEHSGNIHPVLPGDGSVPWYGAPYMNRITVSQVVERALPLLEEG